MYKQLRARLRAIAAVAMTLCASASFAGDSFTDHFTFSGFGTGGFTYSTEKEADFTGRYIQPTGAGRTDKWGFGVDSRLGLQLNAQIVPKLSAVVQVVTEKQYDGEFRPGLEWANLKYQITNDWSVRAGRVVAPTFFFSEASKVGLSYLWVRPPVELYRNSIYTNLDGVETSYRAHVSSALDMTFQAEYGKTDVTITSTQGQTSVSYDSLLLLNAIAEWGSYTARLSYGRGAVKVDAQGLTAFWGALTAAGFSDIAQEIGRDGGITANIGLAGAYDGARWQLAVELNYLKSEHVGFADYMQGFVSAGYRMHSFTPYVLYAQSKRVHTPSVDLSRSGGNPMLAFLLAAANDALTSSDSEQKSITLGERWDLKANLAWKVQVLHVMPGETSISTLTNVSPAFQRGKDYDVVSTTVDFAF